MVKPLGLDAVSRKSGHPSERTKFEQIEGIQSASGGMVQGNSSVLVVDDDLALCRIIQRMLSDGYKVQTSQSVTEAVAAIDQKSFDV
jgi:PleD family two-component response regulator